MREIFCVIWMSCKDLRHDARMTICLILTVAAIALPLMLFFGLKSGVVEVMRQRMVNDPSFMEIIPQGTSRFEEAWFEKWGKNPHVAFLVPRTRELGVSGQFQNLDITDASEKIRPVRADMQPTGPGDWLLKSYQIEIPEENYCVITQTLANKLSAQKGTQLELSVSRQKRGSGTEYGKRTLTVLDVLPQQASGLDTVFISLQEVERVEAFRDGFAVDAYGWKGEKPYAYPVFYSALLFTKQSLDPVMTSRIQQATGFIKIQDITNIHADNANEEKFLHAKMGDWCVASLHTGNNPVSHFKLPSLQNLLRGQESVFIPLAEKNGEGFCIRLETEEEFLSFDLKSTPLWSAASWQGFSVPKDSVWTSLWKDEQKTPAVLLISSIHAPLFQEKKTIAHIEAPNGQKLSLPMHIIFQDDLPENIALTSPSFVGRVNLMFERNIVVENSGLTDLSDIAEATFLLGRQDYSRFRMYARSLDDVAPLAKELEDSGLVIKTLVAEIERVRQMDRYLSLILGLIATASIVGGAICLLASLYASVERKRRAFAVLRLIGMHGTRLCIFPLSSGMIITFFGMSLSFCMYHLSASYINYLAKDFTLPGEIVCYLSPHFQLWAFVWALLIALSAGIIASTRLLKIEASESLRDE